MSIAWPPAAAVIVLLAAATSRGETFTAGIDDLRDPAFWKTVAESLEREPADVAIEDGAYAAIPGVSIVGAGHPRNSLTIRPASAAKVSFGDAPHHAARNVPALGRPVLPRCDSVCSVTPFSGWSFSVWPFSRHN